MATRDTIYPWQKPRSGNCTGHKFAQRQKRCHATGPLPLNSVRVFSPLRRSAGRLDTPNHWRELCVHEAMLWVLEAAAPRFQGRVALVAASPPIYNKASQVKKTRPSTGIHSPEHFSAHAQAICFLSPLPPTLLTRQKRKIICGGRITHNNLTTCFGRIALGIA